MNQYSSSCFYVIFPLLLIGCDQPRSETSPRRQSAPPVVEVSEVKEEKVEPDPVLLPEPVPLPPPVKQARTKEPLRIKIAGGNETWGSQVADVKAVLDSVASELIPFFADRHLEPITVHAQGGPITLYNRGSGGAYTVKLNTGNRLWAQAAFQFSHELCHVLSNYREDQNPNGWFEESICEVASLYTLRAMGKSWQTNPPYSNWKSYHKSLTGYAQNRIDAAQLLGQQPLNEWFAVREMELRKSETQRELNNVVAVKLLPLFEENPAGWESIGWLNVEPSYPDDTFREFMERWHHYVPERHQAFVKKVAFEFGIEIE